jgi:hypothetical protein
VHPDSGSSYLAVGPNAEGAVRVVLIAACGNKYTEGIDLIAVSADGGKTWQKVAAPGKRDWAPMETLGATPRWVEPLASGPKGELYSLWTDIKWNMAGAVGRSRHDLEVPQSCRSGRPVILS